MKFSNIYKGWGFSLIGFVVALLATESYFKVFNIMDKQVDLITYIILISTSIFLVFSSRTGLLNIAKNIYSLFIYKKQL